MLAAVAALVVLKGTVTIGPVTPVCRAGTPCTKPAAHVVLTFAQGMHAVRATTRVDGTYTVKLVPGSYAVTASKGVRITPNEVTVRSGTQHRSFAIDTGLR